MADKIETLAAEFIATELDTAVSTSAETSPMHGGSATLDSLHASSSTRPMGDTQHGGAGTQPLGAGWNDLPDDPEAFARARAELRASEAATAVSLRQFATGYVAPTGDVAGLNKSTESERNE